MILDCLCLPHNLSRRQTSACSSNTFPTGISHAFTEFFASCNISSPTLLYSQWNVRNPDALIEVLESWMPLLPPWMFQNILDQLVNPKLQMEVDRWNPLTDTMPIHAWLHPWLPLMGKLVHECCIT